MPPQLQGVVWLLFGLYFYSLINLGAANYVQNPSFEEGALYWDLTGSPNYCNASLVGSLLVANSTNVTKPCELTVVSSTSYAGSHSLLLNTTYGYTMGARQNITSLTSHAATPLFLKVYASTPLGVGSPNFYGMRLNYGNLTNSLAFAPGNGSGWDLYTIKICPTTSEPLANVSVEVELSGGNGIAYVDAFNLTTPSISARASWLSGPGTVNATINEWATAYIHMRTVDGEAWPCNVSNVNISATESKWLLEATVEHSSSAVDILVVRYRAHAVGTMYLSVTIGGEAVGGKLYPTTVYSSTPDAAAFESTLPLVNSTHPLIFRMGQTLHFNISGKDIYGFPINIDRGVPVIALGSSNPGTCTYPNDGSDIYNCQVLFSSYPTLYSMTITVNGNQINRSPFPIYVQGAPSLIRILPSSADTLGGESVNIRGFYFGYDPMPINVTLDDKYIMQNCTRKSTLEIDCIVPEGYGFKFLLKVKIDTFWSENTNKPLFAYLPPRYISLVPNNGPIGGDTKLTISGSSFGPPGSSAVSVKIGGVSVLNLTQVSHTELRMLAPPGTGQQKNVTVTIQGVTSTPLGLMYSYVVLSLVSQTPRYSKLVGGGTMKICGQDFGVGTQDNDIRIYLNPLMEINQTLLTYTSGNPSCYTFPIPECTVSSCAPEVNYLPEVKTTLFGQKTCANFSYYPTGVVEQMVPNFADVFYLPFKTRALGNDTGPPEDIVSVSLYGVGFSLAGTLDVADSTEGNFSLSFPECPDTICFNLTSIVLVSSSRGEIRGKNLFTMLPVTLIEYGKGMEILKVEPLAMLLTGGEVTVTGKNFLDNCILFFGAKRAKDYKFSDVVKYDQPVLKEYTTIIAQAPTQRAEGYIPVTAVQELPSKAKASFKMPDGIFYSAGCTNEGEYDPGDQECESCPVGGYCPGGRRIRAEAGFWTPSEPSPFVCPCKVKEACPGGPTAVCAEGYTGPCCSGCVQGYYSDFEGVCNKCESEDEQTTILALGTIGIIVLSFYLILVVGFIFLSDASLTNILIILSGLQFQAALGRMAAGELPPDVALFFNYYSLVLIDVKFARPQCINSTINFVSVYYLTIYLYYTMTLISYFGLCIMLGIKMVLAKTAERRSYLCKWYGYRALRVPLMMAYAFYYIFFLRSVQSFLCRTQSGAPAFMGVLAYENGDFSVVPYDKPAYLIADPGVTCAGPVYFSVVCVSLLILLVPITFMPLFSWILTLWQGTAYPGGLNAFWLRGTVGFFYTRYKLPQCYWYGFVRQIPLLILAFCAIFLEDYPTIQFLVAFIPRCLILVVDITLTPFRKRLQAVLDILGACESIYALIYIYVFQIQKGKTEMDSFEADQAIFTLMTAALLISSLFYVLTCCLLVAADYIIPIIYVLLRKQEGEEDIYVVTAAPRELEVEDEIDDIAFLIDNYGDEEVSSDEDFTTAAQEFGRLSQFVESDLLEREEPPPVRKLPPLMRTTKKRNPDQEIDEMRDFQVQKVQDSVNKLVDAFTPENREFVRSQRRGVIADVAEESRWDSLRTRSKLSLVTKTMQHMHAHPEDEVAGESKWGSLRTKSKLSLVAKTMQNMHAHPEDEGEEMDDIKKK